MDLVVDIKKKNAVTSLNRCLILVVTMLASVLMLSPVVLAQAQMTYDLTDDSGSIDWRDGQTDVTSVTEVYSYDEATDTLTVTATFNASDSLAPLPPMLALAYEYGFPIKFDQTVVSTASDSELGPVEGVQNTDNYTYHITGLGSYVLESQNLGSGQAPASLVQKLEAEIDKIIAAGHLSPWLVLSEVAGGEGDQRGEMYWHYPGETLYFLTDVAPLLSGTRLDDLKTYLQNERQTYPPETEVSVPFAAGTRREYCGPTDTLMNKWQNDVIDFRTTGVPRIWNLYGLSRCYELMDMYPTAGDMNNCTNIINQQMANRHWPSLYWRDGYVPHYNAVHGVNQIFAGLTGYIRMARMTGDADAENLGWGLLGRMAALRYAMGKYTQYEYDYGYFTIGDPQDPAWYAEQEAGTWVGDLITWDWTEPIDNVRQVHWLSDCNVMTWEWCSVGYHKSDDGQKTMPPPPGQPANRPNWAQGTAYLLPFSDMVPELGKFLAHNLNQEVQKFCDRIVENQPHWYTSYTEAILGQEIGFNVPGDSYGNFIARAWVLGEDPNALKHYIDNSWVARGDLFYIHKLAETIKAYKGATWTPPMIKIGTGLSTNTDLQQAATQAAQEVKEQLGSTIPEILIISEDLDAGSQTGVDTILNAIDVEFPGVPVCGRGDKWHEYDPYDETSMSDANGLLLMGIAGATVTTAYVTDVHSSYDETVLRARGQQLANNLGTLPQGNHLMLLFGDFHGQGMQKFLPGVTDVLGTDFPIIAGSSSDWASFVYQDGQKLDYGAQAVVLTGDFEVSFSLTTSTTPTRPDAEAAAVQDAVDALPENTMTRGLIWFNCASRKDGDLPAHLTAVQNVVGDDLPIWGHWAGAEAGKSSNTADVTAHSGAGVFALIYEYYTVGDVFPPTPDPLTWASVPHATGDNSVSMSATTATDASGVEYYFECTAGGGHDSGWQESTTYNDTGLTPDTQYSYRVKARDLSANQNTTEWSTTQNVSTNPPDTTPPTPNPLTWSSAPAATGSSSITMTATIASDSSGAEYYFECTAGGGNDSGWQDSPIYEDKGLLANTQYTYRTSARDKSSNQNQTAWSTTQSATTDAPPAGLLAHWTFDEGSGTTVADHSGNGHVGTLSGTPQWIAGQIGDAIDLDGVDDYMDGFSVNLGGVWSIILWAKPLDSAQYQGVVGSSSGGNYINLESDRLHYRGNGNHSASFTEDLDWHHFAVTRASSGDLLIYVDSSQVYSSTDSDASFTVSQIGRFWDSDNYTYEGSVDDVHLYNRVLSQSEIQDIMNGTSQSDTDPPTPSPLTWSTVPYSTGTSSISMAATTAWDTSGVEYYFECTAGGGNDSGWQDSTTYQDTGLTPDTQYAYRVKARDKSTNQNETGWSTSLSATTDSADDTDPPTPDPLTWASVPASTGSSSISMAAMTASDPSGVEYYFECTAGGGNDSGWQDSTTYEDTGLSPSTQYTYRAKARDKSANQNETAWSTAESATTSSTSGAFQQDSGTDGIVSMEAENYDVNTAQGGHTWDAVTNPTDYSGTGAMQALPNIGTNNNTGYSTSSPRLDFQVNFVKTGTHYVWVRTSANESGGDDSLHSGIDNTEIATADRMQASMSAGWTWTNATMDGPGATVNITSTDEHSVNIWMREDGCRVDKVVLTTNSSYTPTGYGPAESPRGGADTDPPTPDPLTWASVPASTGSSSISMTATTASDPSGVEYYFECTAGGGNDSGWQDSTTYEDTGLTPDTQYTYRAKARDKSANQNETAWSTSESATTDTAETNLLAHWTFDEGSGTSVADSSGNGNTGTLSGTPQWITGQIDGAIDLDGVDDYMDGFSVNIGAVWSITVWAKPVNPNQFQGLLGSGTSSTNYVNLESDRLHYYSNTSHSTSFTQDLDWHHFAITRDASGAILVYIDGSQADSYTDTDATFTVSQVGRFWDNSNYTYEGSVDDLRLYDKVLSQAEVQTIMSGGGGEDTDPPTPDPLTWSTVPYSTGTTSISMTATTATDNSGVEYYFDCTAGGGNDSGWQDSTAYEDTGLSPSTQYTYRVQARDKSANQNAGGWSTSESATTDTPPDTDPPTPDPLTWASVPASTGSSSISMTATTASDPSGVEYYFECTAGGGSDSGWQSGTAYEDTGLSPSTQYTYHVKARDLSTNQNETAWSTSESATTGVSDANLLAHWTFDDGSGTSVADSSGNGNTGTLSGTPQWITGQIGGAIGLDGVDDYMDGFSVNIGAVWSITVWAKPLASPEFQGFLGSSSGNYIQLQSNRLHYKGTNNNYTSFTQDLDWHHFAITRATSGAVVVYIDGSQADSYTDTDATFTVSQVGRFWDNSNYTYEGGVDDLRLYDKVLSQAEVQTIMSGGGGSDTDPPTPDPLTWATVPYSTGTTSISMTATTATDSSGVEYYFECTAGGGNDSGWQDSTTYEDTGLSPSTQYTYRVQARDKSTNQNTGGWSTSESTTTDTPPDTNPPTPDPLTWASVPASTGTTSISMTATTASDPSGVEYYFDCTAGGGNDSGWQDSTAYEDTGLSPSTQYTYRVQARDKSANQNTGDWSTSESATTDSAGGDVQIIGSWTSGTTHADPTGTDRALIFIAYAESSTDTSDLGSVTYGGQAMTKLVEKNMHSGWSAYTCAFILNEAGITSATSDDFVVTWNTSPSGTPAYSSVFLSGADQSSMVGQTGTGGSTTTTAETSPLSNNDGDIAIVAGTCGADAEYSTINGFTEAIEVAPSSADGIGGYLSCTGSDVTPGISHTSVNRQSVIGFIVQAGGGAPPDTTPPTPDPLTWATVPYSTGTTSISMTATTASDASGVEYYFECTAGGGNDSGWQSGATYEDTGLSPDTQYTYRSKARDLSANQNETGWSSALSATTDSSSTNMTITGITTNAADYPNSEIPMYKKFEITFDVNDTVATNLQMPYDPSPPNGVSSNGITVNMLFTPDNWTTTYTQPAFYYQEFDHQVKSSKDWIYPTDNYCWKARFAPNQTGTWKFKLSAQDSSGTVQSSEQVFTAVSSSRKGFIKVSPNDARYFEHENGDIFLGLGHNIRYYDLNWDDPVVENEPMFQDFNSKGMQLFRTWLSHWGIYSSCWDNWQSPLAIYHGMDPPSQQLEMAYSYQDHDVSMKVGYNDTDPNDQWPAGAGMFLGFGKRGPAVKTNTDYHIWVRYYIPNTIPGPRIAGNPYGLVLKTGGWLGSYNDPSTFADPGTGTPISSCVYSATGDWTMLETDLTTGSSSDFLDYLYIVLENVQTSSNSFAYIDEVIIKEDLGGGQYGPNILTDSMMNSHQYMDQKKSYAFDKTLELAEQYDVYFKLVLLEKNEWTMNRIDYNGNFVPGSPSNDNFYGDFGNVTKVRWLQQAWWRYCQARWGYSQNIHTWELLNEGDPWSGRHYMLTEKFAQYMHQYGHNMHLSSTSTWGSFPRDEFWGNASYTSVDYADYHKYPPTFNDIAAEVESYSMQYGALRPGGADKPLILGETGYSSEVNNDANGIWFHNFVWAQVNSGGMYQQYWCEHQEFSQTNDPRDHFVPYKNFIEDVSLNNGNYVDLSPTVSDPNMRTWGQKDTTNEKVHLWIQNDRHTWYNIVNENPMSSVSGTIEIAGFSPSQGYTLQWWDPYEPNKAQQITSTEPVTADSGGKITITVSSLTGDIAAKIE